MLTGQLDYSGIRTTIECDNAAGGYRRLQGLLGARSRRAGSDYGCGMTYVHRLQRQIAGGTLLGLEEQCSKGQKEKDALHLLSSIYAHFPFDDSKDVIRVPQGTQAGVCPGTLSSKIIKSKITQH
jgi:hypothetical protein